MADSVYEHGQMDTTQQELTFRNVMRLAKWGSLYIATAVLFFSLWFCTNTGFFGSLIVAVVVLGVGTAVLRERKGPVARH